MSTQIGTITAPAWEVGCWAPFRYPSRSLLCLLSWHSSFLPSFLKELVSGNVGVLMGADRQRTCSFPRKGRVKVLVFQSSQIFAGLQPASLLCPWDSPGKNTGVGSQSCLQRIFPTQGSNPVSCIAGGFFLSEPPGEPRSQLQTSCRSWSPQNSPPGSVSSAMSSFGTTSSLTSGREFGT